MRKLRFLFGIHNHQPVGNFPEVLEKAYAEAYGPFLEVMSRHPRIKWSLHCTGILWDFLFEKHPEYVKAVKKMVAAGQVELLTGGYYEPILSVIPERDKTGQIRRLTALLEREFGCKVRGMWLAERVWEPQLAAAIARAGVEYTVVDDAHFAAAGLDAEKLRGYYITEEQGVKLSIFPISQRLRYAIPFETVDKTMEYLSSCSDESGRSALVMADDGEKFGLWPETHKHVYQDRWLDNFFDAVERSLDWIEPLTFSEYRERVPAEGRVYLPAASYFEMSEWSLPPASQEEFEGVVRQFEHNGQVKRFLRGGFWRNFLTKYAESNNMHKKMLYVSEKVHEAGSPPEAVEALYAGQCNCGYWHGVFGGLYLPHLRTAVYRKLLEAEAAARPSGTAAASARFLDFDCDGRDELLYESGTQNLYFAPHCGGALFEWDVLSKKLNLLNVLTRRQEAYHRRLREFIADPNRGGRQTGTIQDQVKVKERDLDNHLHYDWYRRSSLIDHFLHPDTTFEDFKRGQYGEQGDFVLGEYRAEVSPQGITLSREGTVWRNDRPSRLAVQKEIVPSDHGMKITYRVTSREKREVPVLFAPEFACAFSWPLEGEQAVRQAVKEWTRKDEGFGLTLEMAFSPAMDLWSFPLETVSLSEGGFEKTYQGTVVLPVARLVLPPEGTAVLEITLGIRDGVGKEPGQVD
ncbi:MAG: alpha-amylase/4-alpha-glucanotransferase domain-containing protein [Endomicrobiales bacterium]